MNFSVVIPTFNRAWSIGRAIDSVRKFRTLTDQLEIIVIDDASSDDSFTVAQSKLNSIPAEYNISFSLLQLDCNQGVCGAKNKGAAIAKGNWLIFLDSDDELLPGLEGKVSELLTLHKNFPLHFFRSISPSEADKNIFGNTGTKFISFNGYLFGNHGENLPIIKREVFNHFPYDIDLRGYESLSYLRIIKQCQYATFHALAARIYYVDHNDRLSNSQVMRARYRSIAQGHRRVLLEHHSYMSFLPLIKQLLRLLKANLLSFFYSTPGK